MKLRIRHETRYCYHRPVGITPQRLMMTPRSGHELTLLTSRLRCVPDARLTWAQDVFGNMIATAHFDQPASELTIIGEMVVEQCAPAWPVLLIDPSAHSYPFSYTNEDLRDLGSLAIADGVSDRLAEWIAGFVAGPMIDTLSLLKDLNSGILGSVIYRVRDEEGTQTPDETLDLASGSCRDIAALFIEATRHLGFGARAVSGYLYDPDGAAADGGSTHAWAEIFLPGAGWVAFDPTHQRMGSAQLVTVAVARSNRQIMPVTGSYVGEASDALSMEVSVDVRAI